MKGFKLRLTNRVLGRFTYHKNQLEKFRAARGQEEFSPTWSFSDVQSQLLDENDRYAYFLWYYRHVLPDEVRKHRRHFETISNWCGEDAFHAMWYLLLQEFQPHRCLEIGVHRGQVVSLWVYLAKISGYEIDAWGLSPFNGDGDSVSAYSPGFDYLRDISQSYDKLELGEPKMHVGYSTDQEAKDFVTAHQWSLIYVDGSHDYDVVVQDVALCHQSMTTGGILVMDDASLGTEFKSKSYAFAGHPGPSQAASEPAVMSGFTLIGTCGHNRIFRRL